MRWVRVCKSIGEGARVKTVRWRSGLSNQGMLTAGWGGGGDVTSVGSEKKLHFFIKNSCTVIFGDQRESLARIFTLFLRVVGRKWARSVTFQGFGGTMPLSYNLLTFIHSFIHVVIHLSRYQRVPLHRILHRRSSVLRVPSGFEQTAARSNPCVLTT